MKNVNRYTRAGKHGKLIQCSKCNTIIRIYHFAWSALSCSGCKNKTPNDYMTNKTDYFIYEGD